MLHPPPRQHFQGFGECQHFRVRTILDTPYSINIGVPPCISHFENDNVMLPKLFLCHTSSLSYLLEHPKRFIQHPFLQSWPNLSQSSTNNLHPTIKSPKSRVIFSQHQAFVNPPSTIVIISSFGSTQLEEEASHSKLDLL